MLDIDTNANREGKYRFKQDGAAGYIFKGTANGAPSPTGSRWFLQIDGESGIDGYDTKAKAEEAADRRTRAGYTFYGEDATKVEALGLSYSPLYHGEADLHVRSRTGEFIEIHLSAVQRARLLTALATDFADDVLYGNVTFNEEEN